MKLCAAEMQSNIQAFMTVKKVFNKYYIKCIFSCLIQVHYKHHFFSFFIPLGLQGTLWLVLVSLKIDVTT